MYISEVYFLRKLRYSNLEKAGNGLSKKKVLPTKKWISYGNSDNIIHLKLKQLFYLFDFSFLPKIKKNKGYRYMYTNLLIEKQTYEN